MLRLGIGYLNNTKEEREKKPEILCKAIKKRREFNRLVKSYKSNFFRDQLKKYNGNQIQFWKCINELLGKKTVPVIDCVYRYKTNELCTKEESVNIINEFSSVGEL